MIEIKMFTSPTCGPCKMMKPIVESIVNENDYTLTKICVAEFPEIAKEEQIQFVPTIMIYKDGVLKETITGIKTKNILKSIIEGF